VTAAAFVVEQPGGDIEEVEEAQAVDQDSTCCHVAVLAKKNIIIGGAATEEQRGAFRVDADIVGQIVPAFGGDCRRGHRAHQRVEKTAVGLLAGKLGLPVEIAQIFDELGKIDRRGTTIIAEAAGQARPDIFMDTGRMETAGDNRGGDGARGERFADQRQWTG